MLKLIYFLLLSFSFFSFSAEASTEPSNPQSVKKPVKDKVYLVGVEDVSYYPLFDFNGKNNHQPSFARDLLTTFFDSHHITFKFVALPVKRFDKWYLEHNIDFKFPDNFRWRNDQSNSLGITFSAPVITLSAGTYVNKQSATASRRDIKSLATIRGFHPSLWLQEIKKQRLSVIEESTPLAVVRHVLAGNATATNIDANVINNALQKLNRQGDIVLAEGIFHQQYAYHFSTIQHPEIIHKFDQFLRDNTELVAKLKDKYKIVENF
ncbi:hypothetical protein [Thalassotalea euphylliae]|uniref:hypothetical protein n=1 Tax=Thalassotalea euphylliae TaxID=1655234 RepID=UPI0011C081C2|nr:hypothetical protein [Thalassotalea euphylliae]